MGVRGELCRLGTRGGAFTDAASAPSASTPVTAFRVGAGIMAHRYGAVAMWIWCMVVASASPRAYAQRIGDERIVLQTTYGDIVLGLYPDVAPETTAHVLEAFELGLYTSNHFFRVDRGFVAQVAACSNGRRLKMNDEQKAVSEKTVRGEMSDLKHRRGTLSMARFDDPNSATSSFSILLGNAPHLDGKYAVFGEMISGDEALRAMELVETQKEGIFVKPKERIEILATYVVHPKNTGGASSAPAALVSSDGREGGTQCARELDECKARADSLAKEIHNIRSARLPGN